MNMIDAACMFATCSVLRPSEMSLQSTSCLSTDVAYTNVQCLQQGMMVRPYMRPTSGGSAVVIKPANESVHVTCLSKIMYAGDTH